MLLIICNECSFYHLGIFGLGCAIVTLPYRPNISKPSVRRSDPYFEAVQNLGNLHMLEGSKLHEPLKKFCPFDIFAQPRLPRRKIGGLKPIFRFFRKKNLGKRVAK